MKMFNKTLLASAVTLLSAQTMAAGFQLNSQSATGIGRAFAGDAVIADNASVLARNPSAMAMFDEKALSVGLTYADVTVEVSDANWNRGANIPVVNYDHIDNAAEAKVIPNAFYIQPINDTFAFGLAVFSNYGTGTDTSDLGLSGKPVPGDLVGKTEVTTVNFNASISARINEHWSIGAGIDVIRGEGVLTRDGQIAVFPDVQTVDVEADGFGFGGIVGVTYEVNDNHRFGLSYRFSPDMKVEGTLKKLNPANFAMADYDELTVPMADIAQFAGFHQLTEQFALSYTAQWTEWSNFDSVDLHSGSDTEILKEYGWKNSWFFSVGGTYTLNQDWTLRAGYAFDQGVVADIQSISIPDSDRQWLAVGATYNLSKTSTVDVGFAHVMGEETQVTEKSLGGLNGTLSAVTNTGANYFSVQYSQRF
ncbi:OmpP1/FadL family transporter [Shewanella sp. NIFS-20-20]|uniref:OmpP1/FadL family transporter n=1 Tax=Shewanella sp. NIFS-20-20 TaxID=2853806 RepID=UPI001C476141|nr:outer membrane protein transport protein [Shewanella sp. NIFS-20-20]MBV7314999.1 OmpP1/FadL family transporter [Shewanella sp. NIFS-20-20]